MPEPVSLSVAYVLRAALEVGADRYIDVDGRCRAVAEIEYASAALVTTWWASGARPGDYVRVWSAMEQLAAVRVGLVLVCGGAGSTYSEQASAERCDVRLLETRVWSATPLAEQAGCMLTHGAFLEALDTGESELPAELRLLGAVVTALSAL